MSALTIDAGLTVGAALVAPLAPVDPAQGPTVGGTEAAVVAPDPRPVKVAAGGLSSLLLYGDGTVVSWGQGNMAIGTGTDETQYYPGPVDTSGVLAGKSIVDIATSGYTALAKDSDGALYSWGWGADGMLGDGSTEDALSPVAVDMTGVLAGQDVVQIGVGGGSAMALTADGTLATWGWILGTEDWSSVPVAVDTSAWAGQTVAHLEVGYSNAFVVTTDGKAYGWGSDYYGQLGDGTLTDRATPVPVDMSGALAGRTVVDIEVGSSASFALTDGGQVFGWGSGGNGELGNGTTTGSAVPTPVDMTGTLEGLKVTQLSSTTFGTYALADDGSLHVWGSGYLGFGSHTRTLTPAQVTGPVPDEVTVAFDGIEAEFLHRIDAQSVLVRTPAHTAAVVDVTVTINGEPTVHTEAFTYGTPPVVTTHPVDATGMVGDRVTFTATATGDEAPDATWETSTDDGATWTAAGTDPAAARGAEAGETTVTLDVDLSEGSDGTLVRARFANGLGEVTSQQALISMTDPADPADPADLAAPVTDADQAPDGSLPLTGATVWAALGLALLLTLAGVGTLWMRARKNA